MMANHRGWFAPMGIVVRKCPSWIIYGKSDLDHPEVAWFLGKLCGTMRQRDCCEVLVIEQESIWICMGFPNFLRSSNLPTHIQVDLSEEYVVLDLIARGQPLYYLMAFNGHMGIRYTPLSTT